MARYQVQKGQQGYKNPRIESPSSLRKTPTAPVQNKGLMSAAARARTLRPGIPPIPTLQPVEAAEPVSAAAAPAAAPPAAPTERPVAAPISIQVGMPPTAPRAEAARAIAEKEPVVTEGVPEGGLAGMGYETGREAMARTPGRSDVGTGTEEDPYTAPGSPPGKGYTTAPPEPTAEPAEPTAAEIAQQKTAAVRDQVEPWLWDYMGQALGIDEEDIAGQIEQLKMAESEELANFAQQMAARGMGASGLVGAGMGQIASSTMAAMANVRFEAAKLAVEDRLNRLKSYMAFYGNILSEEIRAALQGEINSLAGSQFDYEKEQDRIADSWKWLEAWAATNGAKDYGPGVLAEISRHLHTINPATGQYYTREEIMEQFLDVALVPDGQGGQYKQVTWKGLYEENMPTYAPWLKE